MSVDPSLNCCVEIHDSILEHIEADGDGFVLTFTAYVHRSVGRPGIDRGTGWWQPLRLEFHGATLTGPTSDLPRKLWDGDTNLSGRIHENEVPMPLVHDGHCVLTLVCQDGERINIEGQRVRGDFSGPARYEGEFVP